MKREAAIEQLRRSAAWNLTPEHERPAWRVRREPQSRAWASAVSSWWASVDGAWAARRALLVHQQPVGNSIYGGFDVVRDKIVRRFLGFLRNPEIYPTARELVRRQSGF